MSASQVLVDSYRFLYHVHLPSHNFYEDDNEPSTELLLPPVAQVDGNEWSKAEEGEMKRRKEV